MKNNQPSSWNIIEAKKVFSEWLKWIAINYSVSHLSMMWWSSWYLKCFWTQKYRPVLWNSDLNISINTTDDIFWKFYRFALRLLFFIVS